MASLSAQEISGHPIELLNEDLMFHDPLPLPVVADKTVNNLVSFTLPQEAYARKEKMELELNIREGGVFEKNEWWFHDDKKSDPPPTPEEHAHFTNYSDFMIKLEQTGLPLLTLGHEVEALEEHAVEIQARIDAINDEISNSESDVQSAKKQRLEEDEKAATRWAILYEELWSDYVDKKAENVKLLAEKKEKLQRLVDGCLRYQACAVTIDVADLSKAVADLTEACAE